MLHAQSRKYPENKMHKIFNYFETRRPDPSCVDKKKRTCQLVVFVISTGHKVKKKKKKKKGKAKN